MGAILATASGRILIFTSGGLPFLCIVIRERATTAGKGEKSGHELWASEGGEEERVRVRERDIHGVIRFLANYSRVPLTSPICLDYERRARPSSRRPPLLPAGRFKALLPRRCSSTRFVLPPSFVSFFLHRPRDIASCCCEMVRMDRTISTDGVSLIFPPPSFSLLSF